MNHLTHVQALQFAIEFAQAEAVPSDAAQQIRQFVRTSESPAMDWSPQSAADLAALQQRTRVFLQTLVERGFVTVDRKVKTLLVRAGPPQHPMPNYSSSVRDHIDDVSAIPDRFINRVIDSFKEVGLEKLQVCQAPPAGSDDDAICGRLFLKVTRKEFCSSQCQKRIWARKAAHATREKEKHHGKTTRTR